MPCASINSDTHNDACSSFSALSSIGDPLLVCNVIAERIEAAEPERRRPPSPRETGGRTWTAQACSPGRDAPKISLNEIVRIREAPMLADVEAVSFCVSKSRVNRSLSFDELPSNLPMVLEDCFSLQNHAVCDPVL
jgi:hypothetical protein